MLLRDNVTRLGRVKCSPLPRHHPPNYTLNPIIFFSRSSRNVRPLYFFCERFSNFETSASVGRMNPTHVDLLRFKPVSINNNGDDGS